MSVAKLPKSKDLVLQWNRTPALTGTIHQDDR
jgi:hypothetical protein